MRKLNKKHIRATLGAMSVLFLTPLAVYALMLRSAEKVNQFRPAKQNALIAENDDIPVVTQEKELKWKNTGNQPIAVKEVTVGEISDPNGEYMRVRLVPSWYDESGCVVSGVEGVTDICTAEIRGNTLVFKDSGNEDRLIVNLADDWIDSWQPVPNQNDVMYFQTKNLVKSGETGKKLMTSVEVSNATLQHANANNIFLHFDVLADSVQTLENGSTVTNPKW